MNVIFRTAPQLWTIILATGLGAKAAIVCCAVTAAISAPMDEG